MPPPGRSKTRGVKLPQSRKTGNAIQQGQQTSKTLTDAVSPRAHALSFELQQLILNTFNSAFPIVQDPEHLKQIIQEVKGHLFNRDFSAAFGQSPYLQAYALRWSAARGLAYSQIFSDPKRSTVLFSLSETNMIKDESVAKEQINAQDSISSTEAGSLYASIPLKVVCIGGGAGGEVVGLTAAHRAIGASAPLRIVAVDSADWSDPISKLSSALATAPPLSTFSSEASKARPENQPLQQDSSKVNIVFLHQDVLSWPVESFQETFQDTSLCTMMFTLNELFSSSLPKTTAFLLHLTDVIPAGSHLLVIDSPGSYSEISLGRSSSGSTASSAPTTPSKKYPMKWLLDHTLLEVAGQAETRWVKLESEDSLWFRIDQKEKERFKYSIDLENMRYQLHLYRKQ